MKTFFRSVAMLLGLGLLPVAAHAQKKVIIEDEEPNFPVNCTNTLDWKFIASVKECIEKNMGDLDFGVDVLSNQHHMSRTSFYNKLKALTGYAPADYIRMIRLQRAAQLLKQKEYTITEIAEIVGFSDAKYLRSIIMSVQVSL